MKEKELKELKLTKNIIIPFPNFQQNTIISPTQMNDNFEEIEHAYNTLIDNHNGAITKVNKALAEITSSDNEALTNEQFRVQAENIRVQNESERVSNEEERISEEQKRIAMYNTHLNDELRREQKHTQMIGEFDTKISEVSTFVDTKTEEIEEFVDLKTNQVNSFITTKTNEVDTFVTAKGQEVQNAINSIPPKSELIGAKGDKGDKGEKGDKGDRGEQGIQGIQGIQGLKGDKGDKGEQGERGLQGIQGLKGDKGDKGDKGEKGDKGDPGQNTIIDYIYEEVNSPNPSVSNSIEGSLEDIQILGNTVQDPNNLADIKSVGELQEDGTYKMSILSCGKNLFNPLNKNIECSIGGSQNKVTYKVEGDKIIIKSNPSVSSDWGWVEFKNIKVTPNKSYTIHPNATVIKGNVCVFVFDSNNTKLFEIPNTSKTFIPTTKHITIRLYVQTTTSYTDAEIHYKPQLEEGAVATPYEPYQENKCDILSPCQLEKVGDVADRLYYDDVDKAWCIEKNVKTIKLNGTEQGWYLGGGSMFFEVPINDIQIPNKPIICDKYQHIVASTGDETGKIATVQHQAIRIHPSDMTGLTLDIFKRQLSQDNVLVKYPTTEPQKIVLPLNTQIALNSFFGTTHVYMESGEVEGTIKCKIPKSLGATVQSLNNKTDILSDRIEAIEGLKDSQNMKYETDKGYLVCKETKNGVIDDLKIEGKTLVNRTDIFNKVNPTGGGAHRKTSNSLIVDYNKCGELDNSYSLDEINVFKSGQIYTIIIDIIQNTLNQKVEFYPMIWDFATIISGNQFVNTGEVGRKIFVIKSNKDYALKLAYASPSQATQGVTGLVEFKDIMVLDGDYTNIELPNYFEGLMSVGQDVDKIEVLSRKEDGNLFDGQLEGVSIETTHNGEFGQLIPSSSDFCSHTKPFMIKPNTTYVVGINDATRQALCFMYDYNMNPLNFEYGNGSKEFTTPSNARYCRVRFGLILTEAMNYEMYLIEKDSTDLTHQSDKKQILFYNENGELEPIQELHEWDSIEKHSDNKWYYHKRSGKVVLNGSETISLNANLTKENTMYFEVKNISNNELVLCDRFMKLSSGSHDEEGILGNKQYSNISIRILKSKLSTQDVEGFKQWLQANNVTVVYQLAQEEVYELAPLHLDSYANETLILCNSGAISPKMEFSITSHINELVKSQGDRISLLEEKMYKALKQVLAGDMYSLAELLYPEDFVSKEEPIDVPTLLI